MGELYDSTPLNMKYIFSLASSSKIAHTLCKAAENGKEVIVLMELRARFDEANNIEWSKLLEDSGCQVEYGVENFKCHSKICLITLKSKGKVSHITQIGTGNYNEKTNAMYTDLSLMTASESIGNDGINYNVKTDGQQVFMEQSMHKKAPEFHTPESNIHKIFSRINAKLKIIFNKSEVK